MSRLLDHEPTVYHGRPRYEGANIRTWIGFKHFEYLVEEAVLQYFRDRGYGPAVLYHTYGLGLEIVDSSIQLPNALNVDDEVTATVTAAPTQPAGMLALNVKFTATREAGNIGDETEAKVLSGKVRVALVREKDAPGDAPAPADLDPYVVSDVAELDGPAREPVAAATDEDVRGALVPEGSNAFLWSWRVPYFYCHYSHRLQHSGYVRALEEIVDRFLAERDLSIYTMLEERGWIPVVSRARVRMLADVLMEETLHTVFTVEDVIKNSLYTARFDAYVRRDGRLVHTATGSIMHGYAISRGEGVGSLAQFDERALTALLGGGR